MMFVQRNQNGKVTGVFANAQPGYAEEELADDHADIVGFCSQGQTPENVTPRQIRMALSRAGLRTSVEAAIAAGSQDLKDWYEFSTTFQRSQPLVVQMGVDLGQTPEQLDALWQLAATL